MTHTKESLAEHRRHLSEEIFRQRAELAQAFRGIAKPLQYTQTAIVGLQALRKNAWLIALGPTAVSLAFSFFGWKKAERPSLLGRLARRRPRQSQEQTELDEKAKKPLARWIARGWALFKIYRRLRPFFP
jgi:hypothetical protein